MGGRSRRKLVLLVAFIGFTGLLAIAAVALLGRAMANITRSDETSAIFNVSADLDHELADAVFWLPDAPDVPREIPPLARDAITEVWLRAWSQPLILSDGSDPVGASFEGEATDGILIYFDGPGRVAMLDGADEWFGLPPHQISHDLRLTFYSEDGAIAAVTSERSRVLRALPVGDRVEWYETVETFEVVFVLSEKDWRVHHIVRTGVVGEWIAAAGPEPIAITNEPIRSITWRPAAQSPTEFWSTPNMTAVEDDLDQIVDLGFNTVRLELPFEELGGRDVESVPLQVAQLFLDAAEERELDVTLALLNGRTEHQPVNWDTDDRHILAVVQELGDHPALALWELATAPDADIGVDRLDQSMMHAWLVHISRTLRNVDDDTPLTVAFATARAAAEAPPVADVVSFAYPGSPEALAIGVDDVRSVWTDRPIMVGDMTSSTRLSLLPGGMTEGEQARFYADALLAIDDAGLAGFNVSTLSDFQVKTVALRAQVRAEEEAAAEEAAIAAREAEFPSPPEPEPKERGPEVHLAPVEAEVTWPTGSAAQTGLIRVDGTLKPAAEVFVPGADLEAVPTPTIVEKALKPFNFVMLTLFAVVLGGWIVLVLWDKNLFPFSLLRRHRTTDAEAPTAAHTPPAPTGEPDNSRPPPLMPPPPAASSPSTTPIGRNDPVTAPTHDLAPPPPPPEAPDVDVDDDVDDDESLSRVGRVKAWFSRPVLVPPHEASPEEAAEKQAEHAVEVLTSEAFPTSAIATEDGAVEVLTSEAFPTSATAITQSQRRTVEPDPADISPPPAPDLDPTWVPAEPLPSAKLAQVSPLETGLDVPRPPARPTTLAGPISTDPASTDPTSTDRAGTEPAPSPVSSSADGRSRSRSLAVDVLPQPRRAAQASVGDIAVLEVDLQAIDRALAFSPRPEIGADVSRYGSFMIRTACIVTEECARTGGEPITVEIEGHAPGRRQRMPRANEMRLTALARALHDGDDRGDRRSTDQAAVRVALSGSSEGRMIIAGSEDDVPTITLIHLGKRTVTTTDSLGFQVSSEHTMGLITVAAGSTPVAADAYLARVRSILERRDWIGELD